jgi:hypothetical protein
VTTTPVDRNYWAGVANSWPCWAMQMAETSAGVVLVHERATRSTGIPALL